MDNANAGLIAEMDRLRAALAAERETSARLRAEIAHLQTALALERAGQHKATTQELRESAA